MVEATQTQHLRSFSSSYLNDGIVVFERPYPFTLPPETWEVLNGLIAEPIIRYNRALGDESQGWVGTAYRNDKAQYEKFGPIFNSIVHAVWSQTGLSDFFPGERVEALHVNLNYYQAGDLRPLHTDNAPKGTIFSLLFCLDKEFTGGAFCMVDDEGRLKSYPLKGGDICAFDGEREHLVEEVLSGMRYTVIIDVAVIGIRNDDANLTSASIKRNTRPEKKLKAKAA